MNLFKGNNFYMLVVTMCFFLVSCSSQNEKCSKFKEGVFKYSDSESIEIYRDDLNQVEIDIETNMKVYTSVFWETECKYVLTYDKIVNSTGDFDNRIGQKIYIEIIEMDSIRYKCHMKSDFSEDKFWVYKISNLDNVPNGVFDKK